MEKIWDKLSLTTVLRYLMSGGVFWVSFYYTKDGLVMPYSVKEYPGLLGIIAVGFGMLLYTLHRSLTNPVLEHTLPFKDKWDEHKPLETLIKRWVLVPKDEVLTNIAQQLSTWGAHVHFLYTSWLAVWLGAAATCFLPQGKVLANGQTYWPAIVAGFLMLLGAYINDRRKVRVEQMLIRTDEGAKAVAGWAVKR